MRIVSMKFARSAAATSIVAACALALGPAAATAATSHAWATDGFDAANSGFNPNETMITGATFESLDWQWGIAAPVAAIPCNVLSRAPVVAGGRVFFSDERGFGAYNAATGVKL